MAAWGRGRQWRRESEQDSRAAAARAGGGLQGGSSARGLAGLRPSRSEKFF